MPHESGEEDFFDEISSEFEQIKFTSEVQSAIEQVSFSDFVLLLTFEHTFLTSQILVPIVAGVTQ